MPLAYQTLDGPRDGEVATRTPRPTLIAATAALVIGPAEDVVQPDVREYGEQLIIQTNQIAPPIRFTRTDERSQAASPTEIIGEPFSEDAGRGRSEPTVRTHNEPHIQPEALACGQQSAQPVEVRTGVRILEPIKLQRWEVHHERVGTP